MLTVFNPCEGDHIYDEAPPADNIKLAPGQNNDVAGFIVTTGNEKTVTTAVALLTHPLKSVPKTVYVEVTTGEATGFDILIALKALFGPH